MVKGSGEILVESGHPDVIAKIIWSSTGDLRTNSSLLKTSLRLIYGAQSGSGDYTELDLRALMEEWQYEYLSVYDYTEESWENYFDIINYWYGQIFDYSLWGEATATPLEINQAVEEITLAKDELIIAEAYKGSLIYLVDEISRMDETNYDPYSWINLLDYLSYANDVLSKDSPLQSEVDQAEAGLSDAVENGLIPTNFERLYIYSETATTTDIVYEGLSIDGFNEDYISGDLLGYKPKIIIIPEDIMVDGVLKEVVAIGSNAFNNELEGYYDSLSQVSIPNNVVEIREKAFYMNEALETINIDSENARVEVFGESSFTYAAIQSLILGPSVRRVEADAFSECYIYDILIDDNVIFLDVDSFDPYTDKVYANEVRDDEWPILRGREFTRTLLLPIEDWPF